MYFLKMDKLGYPAIIILFELDGLSPADIHPKLVKNLFLRFLLSRNRRRGGTFVGNDPREELPKTAITDKNIETVDIMNLDDRLSMVYVISKL